MPLDILIQRYLQDCSINTITKSYNYKNIYPSRGDYIRDVNGDYDYWLLNPVWKVTPCIDFVQRVIPLIMTCLNHNDECNKVFLHLPRQLHHILPAHKDNQPCHAVINKRTI